MDRDQVYVIEMNDASRVSGIIDWLGLPHVKDVDGSSPQSGSVQAKIFCDWPDLLNALLFMGTEGDFLVHHGYQTVDAKVHIRVYYTDGREFFDQRYIYFFGDEIV